MLLATAPLHNGFSNETPQGDPMATKANWLARTTQCAQHWREPRWRLQLLSTPGSWVHARLPRIAPAAVIVAGAHRVAVHGR